MTRIKNYSCYMLVSLLTSSHSATDQLLSADVHEAPVHFKLDNHIYLPAPVYSTLTLNLVFDTGLKGCWL